MVNSCHKVIVLCLDRWKESVGVQAEIEIARAMDITDIAVKYLDP